MRVTNRFTRVLKADRFSPMLSDFAMDFGLICETKSSAKHSLGIILPGATHFICHSWAVQHGFDDGPKQILQVGPPIPACPHILTTNLRENVVKTSGIPSSVRIGQGVESIENLHVGQVTDTNDTAETKRVAKVPDANGMAVVLARSSHRTA